MDVVTIHGPELSPPQRFLVRVWCEDCGNGEDTLGCFDGGDELRGRGEWKDEPEPFDTIAEAEAYGWKFIDAAPYDFEVVDSVTHVAIDDAT